MRVEELCGLCLCDSDSFSRVTFGESSLKVIGGHAFYRSGLKEIRIPSAFEGIYGTCFSMCEGLFGVAFGE